MLNMSIIVFSSDIIGNPKQFLPDDPSSVASNQNNSQQQTPGAGGGSRPRNPNLFSPNDATNQSNFQQQTPTLHSSSQTGGGSRPGTGTFTLLPNSPQSTVHQVNRGIQLHVDTGAPTSVPAGNSMSTPYGRPVISSSYEPAPVYSNRGPISRNQAPARILPIAALNPYQGRWTIKARVTSKGDLRRFHNAKGDGKVFHFDLLDAEGGEIRVTCFNAVADQFFDQVEVGKVYTISKGSLKPAQRNFNHLKNDWEIFLESSSIVQYCSDEDASIPQQQFNFIPITEVENMQGNAMVDVIGVVVEVSPTNTILRKNGTETQKRSAQLIDMSGHSVELTMWGTFCAREGQSLQDKCDSGHSPVLAIKAGRISDFSGKSVGTISTTQLLVDPGLPEANQLKRWYENEGKKISYQSISQEGGSGTHIEMRKTIAQIKDEGLGRSERPDWIAVKGTISFIKTDTFCYTACPLLVGDRQCNKKVVMHGDGMWHCDRCDKSIPECDYRYLLSVQIQDHTGVTWVTAFQEAGEEIIGVTAKELYNWKQHGNFMFEDTIQSLLFTENLFKLKVKEENYNDELRVKCTVIKTERLDFQAESRALLALIRKLASGDCDGGTGHQTSGFTGGSSAAYGGASLGYGSSVMAANAYGSSQREKLFNGYRK